MNHTATPIKSISHPLWGLSLAVLLANDHVLKGAGILPGWVTGKLSDLAGYFLFPSLLATLLRVRTQRGLLLCHVAAASLLVLTELSPAFCQWVLAVFGHRLWPDPTDLVALASIVLSWRILAPLALRAETPRVVSERRSKVLVMLGAVASVATSPSRPPRETTRIWERSSEVFVENQRGQSLQVRVSAPRQGVQYDCETALARPQELFNASHFSVVQHVTLGAGDSLPLSGYNLEHPEQCNVVWIAAEGSPEYLAVWRSGTFATGSSAQVAGGAIRIEQGSLSGPEGLLTLAPSVDAPPLSAECAPSAIDSEPAWSAALPASGPHSLRQIIPGSDGCDVLVLQKGSTESRFTLCSEPVALPFVVGDNLSFSTAADGSDGLVVTGQSSGKIVTLTLVRKALNAINIRQEPVCQVAAQRCGSSEAMRLQVSTSLGLTRPLARGEQQSLLVGSDQVTAYVRRADRVLLTDRACDATGALGFVASYITLSIR